MIVLNSPIIIRTQIFFENIGRLYFLGNGYLNGCEKLKARPCLAVVPRCLKAKTMHIRQQIKKITHQRIFFQNVIVKAFMVSHFLKVNTDVSKILIERNGFFSE